jgi:hypothetical protein
MNYFAKVVDGVVENVIVADPEFFNTFVDDTPGKWVQTFFQGEQRKNYAGIGSTYDETRDAFIHPQPHISWVLDEETCQWEAPIMYPTDGAEYYWEENTVSWELFTPPQPGSSWTLNTSTNKWESPVPYPDDDKFYTWDEETTNWKEVI